MKREMEPCQLIERSIIKKYRKELWTPFIVAVKRYELVQEDDRIAVCISGGKDSMLMAKLMQELQRHSDVPFELVFLVMDPGYNEINRQKIESNAELLHIPVTIFESNIFAVANSTDKNPCYLCARMRRGHLYSKAKELGCNKIALGHHFNDVIETTVMGMFYGSQLQAMPPKLHSTSFPGMDPHPPHVLHPGGGHSSPGGATTSWNSSSAPAASPRTAPSATTAAAAPSGRRSRPCCAGSSATTPTSRTASSAASMRWRWTPCPAISPRAWSTASLSGSTKKKKNLLHKSEKRRCRVFLRQRLCFSDEDADQPCAALVEDAFQRFLQAGAGLLRHMQQFAL